MNAKVLAMGVLLLGLMFPLLWLVAGSVLPANWLVFGVFAAEFAVVIAVLFAKTHWEGRRAEQQQARIVAEALRKSPI